MSLMFSSKYGVILIRYFGGGCDNPNEFITLCGHYVFMIIKWRTKSLIQYEHTSTAIKDVSVMIVRIKLNIPFIVIRAWNCTLLRRNSERS